MIQSAFSLNPSQRRAVDHQGGPLLVTAGPGTGKTRTLTCRIADLVVRRNTPPESILALTFTNRAAGEMRARLKILLGEEPCEPAEPDPGAGRPGAPGTGRVQRMFIGTFHALGLLLVRENHRLLGFEREPVLYDEEDRVALIRGLPRAPGAGTGRAAVDGLLERMRKAAAHWSPGADEDHGRDEEVELYEKQKRLEGAVDFDDLILLPLDLFQRRPDRLDHYRGRWRHVLVDEYQDVNHAQVALLRQLAGAAESVTAIGDPDQAIYSFRGSDPAHFLRFGEDFPGAEVVRLGDNYRSTVTIINASDRIIRGRDREGERAAARPREGQGLLLEISRFATDKAEATFVGRRIERMAGGDIAVLYRLNAQARELCAALDRGGIPFQRVGIGQAGRDQASRAVLALARLVVRAGGNAARRTLESLGMKEKTIRSALDAIRPAPETQADLLLRAGRVLTGALPGRADAMTQAAAALALRAGDEGGGLFDFITAAPLAVREDPFAARCEKVTLSTLHAAKGLEFPVVFIIGMEDGLIPFLREGEEDRDGLLDEERRLLYVGMTRARDRLLLSSARRRFLFGRSEERVVSPFLEEMPSDLVQFVREKQAPSPRRDGKRKDGQMDLF